MPATEQQGAPVVRRYAASRGISSGSPNGVAVDKIDDWECESGPRMDVFDDWEIKMDVLNVWESDNVSQSCKTSTRPTR